MYPALWVDINDSASLLEKHRTVLAESLGLWDASLIRVYYLSKARFDLCRGVANEIFALGIQYRGCLWGDLRSSVVLYGAGNRWAGSTSDYASDVLLRIRRGDAGVATPVLCDCLPAGAAASSHSFRRAREVELRHRRDGAIPPREAGP